MYIMTSLRHYPTILELRDYWVLTGASPYSLLHPSSGSCKGLLVKDIPVWFFIEDSKGKSVLRSALQRSAY